MPKQLAPGLRDLDNREEKLDVLLENWNDARDPAYGRSGIRGGDGGDGMMPLVWNMSYRELERCLWWMGTLCGEIMRPPSGAKIEQNRPVPAGTVSPLFRAMRCHLVAWYMRSRRRRAALIRTDKKGRQYHVTTAAGPQYVISIVREGNPAIVLKALEWVSAEFVGEVYLPREFMEAA